MKYNGVQRLHLGTNDTVLIFYLNTRMKAFVVLMLVLPIVMSENCPDPRDVPVLDERTQKYTAALVYQVLTGLYEETEFV